MNACLCNKMYGMLGNFYSDVLNTKVIKKRLGIQIIHTSAIFA